MNETIYTTWMRRDNHWVINMLEEWRKSGKRYLCFPWILFKIHTLSDTPFWMYFYYAKGRTDVSSLKGRIEFRVRVISWRPTPRYEGDDVCIFRGGEDGTAWFLCDRFEEVVTEKNELLSLKDFNHIQDKNLISTIRNSIPRVNSKVKIIAIRQYPE